MTKVSYSRKHIPPTNAFEVLINLSLKSKSCYAKAALRINRSSNRSAFCVMMHFEWARNLPLSLSTTTRSIDLNDLNQRFSRPVDQVVDVHTKKNTYIAQHVDVRAFVSSYLAPVVHEKAMLCREQLQDVQETEIESNWDQVVDKYVHICYISRLLACLNTPLSASTTWI